MTDRDQQEKNLGFFRPLTRRKVLQTMGFAGLVSGFSGFGAVINELLNQAAQEGKYFTPEIITILESEIEGRLQQAGLGDYSDLFIKAQRFTQTYGATTLPEVFSILNDVVIKDPADLEKDAELKSKIEWLKTGWGEKFDQATEEALVKIKNVTIDTSQTGDTREDVEKLLLPLAHHLPAFIHALPDKIVILPAAGYCGVTEVGLTSPKSPGAFVTLIHELTHATEYPDRIKPYVTKEHFIAYLEAQLVAVQTTCDLVFSSNLQSALTLKKGDPWLNFNLSEDLIVKQRQFDKLKSYEGRFLSDAISVPEEYKDNGSLEYAYRFTWVGHEVGSKLYEIHQKQLRGEKLTSEEINLFDEPLLFDLMGDVVDEVRHYYVGPLQQKNGGLPTSDVQIAAGILDHLNGALETQRLMSFSKQRTPDLIRPTTLAEIFGLMPKDTKQNEAEVVEQFPFHGSLMLFGATSLEQMEFRFSERFKPCRLYELPVNPHATDAVTLFLYFSDLDFLGNDKEQGLVISVPKATWDKDLDSKKRSSSITMTKDGSAVISFKTNKDSELELVYAPGIGVQQVIWKNKDVRLAEPQACSISIQPKTVKEFVAQHMLLRTGDLDTQKETSLHTALCLQTGPELRLFPYHQNGITMSYLPLLGLRRGGVILGRDMEGKCFTLPEMIPVVYNVTELTKVPNSPNYTLQPLDNMYLQPEGVGPVLLKFTSEESTQIAKILAENPDLFIGLKLIFINTGINETSYILPILDHPKTGETSKILGKFIPDVEWG